MPTLTPPRPAAVLDSAVVWTHACLQLARSSPLSAPTPCTGWDLGDLLAHMEDSLATLIEAAELGHVLLERPVPRSSSDQVVDRLVRQACTTRAVWRARVTSAPIGVDDLVLGRETVVLVGALEIAVHGWDVACSAGRRRALPEDLAVPLLEVARAVVTPDERGSRFAPPVPVPDPAPASARLLAHLGRVPDWRPAD